MARSCEPAPLSWSAATTGSVPPDLTTRQIRRGSRALVRLGVVAFAACFFFACSGGEDAPPPTTVDLAPEIESWLEALPPAGEIWDACDPGGEDSLRWGERLAGAWEALAGADAPPDPVAGAWRSFLEAGTVWARSVQAGVDDETLRAAVLSSDRALRDSLGTWVPEDVLQRRLPPLQPESLSC